MRATVTVIELGLWALTNGQSVKLDLQPEMWLLLHNVWGIFRHFVVFLNILKVHSHIRQLSCATWLHPDQTDTLPACPSPPRPRIHSFRFVQGARELAWPEILSSLSQRLPAQRWTSVLSPNWLGTHPHDMSICPEEAVAALKKPGGCRAP